jgi:tetratricopeptide (TPR) repeat protein
MKRALRLVACALPLAVASVSAQAGRGGDPQSRLQLEAATLESEGDLEGAEAAYRRLLEMDPLAAGTVFALERVLRASDQLGELQPIVVAFLARNAHPQVQELRLRLLTEADSANAMVSESERWLAADGTQAAYLGVARTYARAFGPERALEVLRRGRTVAGARDAFALEIGDQLAANGDVAAAVDEWALAVGDGARLDEVVSRVTALGEGAAASGRRLVAALADSDVPERSDAALTAALAFGLEAEAIDLAESRVEDLDGRARDTYLEDVARRARAAQRAPVAAWALAELGGGAANPEERRQIDRRIVEVSLESGDTTLALAAQRRVAASYGRSTEDGRRAQAEVIRLEAAASPEQAPDSWRAFRAAFPDAPELDEVAAAVAMSLQARGNEEGAAAVLDGIEGPKSTLERGYLLLAQGQTEPGRQALLDAVGGLPAREATEIIQFSSLLGRLSDAGVQALVTAGVEAHRGRGVPAARALLEQTGALREGDRAPLLAEAGRMAQRGGDEELAAEIRQRLVDDHPDAPEVAEASLALARHKGRSGGDVRAAIRLLEELIIAHPNSAIVPEARLELERLRSRDS